MGGFGFGLFGGSDAPPPPSPPIQNGIPPSSSPHPPSGIRASAGLVMTVARENPIKLIGSKTLALTRHL